MTILLVPVNHKNRGFTVLTAFLLCFRIMHSVALFPCWQLGQKVVQDLSSSWPFVVAGLAMAMVLCLIYIVLMRWFAGVMVWFSLLGTIGLLAYCKYRAVIWQLSVSTSHRLVYSNIAPSANCPQVAESADSYKLGGFHRCNWGLWSPGTSRRVTGQVVSCICNVCVAIIIVDEMVLGDEGSTLLWNVRSHIPSGAASGPMRQESSHTVGVR